jgi:hypothetical protein
MRSIGDQTSSALRLRRRDFITLCALAPLAPCVERWAGAEPLAGAADPTDPASVAATAAAGRAVKAQSLPLSIGYLEGSEQIQNLSKLAPDLRLLTVGRRGDTLIEERVSRPSHEYPAGDPSLVGGAVRLTVHDLYPHLLPQDPELAARWPRSIDLDILSPMMTPAGATATFAAWSYRRLPAEDRSARVSLLVWPDWYSNLSLHLRVVGADPAAPPSLLTATFTLGADSGRPRLLKGVYLLGLAPGTWDAPAQLPDDASQLPPEALSVLMTVEPIGIRS